ncbi:MAG: alpha/beta hydrolase [Thermoleophilia bacterium]|nr:alpha/beta hydrolase [Thermoleophilia bacterium]
MPLAKLAHHALYYELHPAHDPRPELPPIVLAMGIGGRCAGWLPFQVPTFSEHRPVLIYDHRGVGESEDPGGPFTTADLASDLIALLDVLDLPRVDAAGYFLGGMVMQEAALAAPERFRHLVLVGTWARPDAKRRMLLESWAALGRAGTAASAMVRHRLIWTLSDESLEERELVETAVAHLDDGRTPVTGEAFARQCDACLGHDALDRLARLAHPTLAICGRRDLLTPTKFSREIAEAMPNARDLALAYSGHAVMAERPERFNQVVLNFLDEERASG